MTGRRSSARLAAQSSSQSSQNSSPPRPKPSPVTKKRKNEASGSSPSAKRGKKDAEPEQKTLEATFQNGTSDKPAPEKPEQEMKDHAENKSEETEAVHANGDSTKAVQENEEPSAVEQKQQQEEEEKIGDNKVGVEAATTEPKNDTQPTEATESKDEAKHTEANGNGNAVEPGARSDKDIASTILEKGIIYFFFRPRVNVDEPQDVNDVARSFMVLRPLPLDAKLGDGPIGDEKNCRLLVLPKKVLPKSGKDRFLTFVEKSKTSFADLKESFLTGSEYYTKTQGMKHTAPVTPLAEGIYAITSTGRESHLAYIINIPSTPGEVQKDFGLRERGSFVASVKNPDKPPTGQQQSLPQGPEYPSELIDEFRGLRWKPLEPKFLDYDNAQFLMIGEDFDKAIEERPKDDREGNVPAMQEMEKLEGEDEIRIKHLKGDDAIFSDLHVTSKDIPEVQTTW